MGGKGSGGYHGGGRPKKEKVEKEDKRSKSYDAVSWLEIHPEDIPIARENLIYRDKGFDSDGARQLYAAVCLKACADYKRATTRIMFTMDKKEYDKLVDTIRDCEEFFASDIFQFFINRIPVDEVKKAIRNTPDGLISNLWKASQNKQKPIEAL